MFGGSSGGVVAAAADGAGGDGGVLDEQSGAGDDARPRRDHPPLEPLCRQGNGIHPGEGVMRGSRGGHEG
eukprot:7147089-Pyramimonas_sp.AAC.1